MTATSPAPNSRRWVLDPAVIAIVSVGFLLRVAYVVLNRHIQLLADTADYNRLAINLAHGHGFGPSNVVPGGDTALRPPSYPYFLAGVYRVTGDSILAARLVQAALGAVSVGLFIWIAWMVWGRRTGLVAGAVAAVYPTFIATGSALLSESLFLPLFLGGIGCAIRYRNEPTARWIVAAGVLTGFAILTRPIAIILVPVMIICATGWPVARSSLAPLAAGIVAIGLVILPWTIRNAVVMNAFIPVTDYTGFDLAGTYNATTQDSPVLPTAWEPEFASPQLRPILEDRSLTELQMATKFHTSADDYIKAHPTSVLRTAAYGTVRMADLTGTSWAERGYAAIGLGRPSALASMLGWYLVIVLAAIGLLLPGRKRLPWLFWLVPVLAWLMTVAVLADDRYRMPVEVFAVLLASLPLVRLLDKLRPEAVSSA